VGKGQKLGIFILGGGLLIALVVTMVRISGPASDSSGEGGVKKREALLGEKAREILARTSQNLPRLPGSPVLLVPELRFEGQVLRIHVAPAWESLPFSRRTEIVDRVSADYVGVWQKVMKSHHEPAIVFVEGGQRVALHTQIDHWVAGGPASHGKGPD